jgi:hypothetical protein
MRLLWQGGEHTHRGDFYDVFQARLYTLPEEPVTTRRGSSVSGKRSSRRSFVNGTRSRHKTRTRGA